MSVLDSTTSMGEISANARQRLNHDDDIDVFDNDNTNGKSSYTDIWKFKILPLINRTHSFSLHFNCDPSMDDDL